jgi:mannose-6-phosphate isomerase-like protein (cupin superfamily)
MVRRAGIEKSWSLAWGLTFGRKEKGEQVPAYRGDTLASRPPWVDIDDYELVYLDFREENAGIRRFVPSHPKEHLVCLNGEVTVEWPAGRVTLKRKDWIDISGFEATVTTIRTTAMTGTSEVLWMAGHWPETFYISIFQFSPDKPLEMHYHDNDEYWFVFRGSFEAICDGESVPLRWGDLLATRMGHEHGIPAPPEIVEGVGFTPKLEGRKRFGHLVRERDGVPEPMPA